MDDQMEYKLAPTEFKAQGDQGEYEGYFSVIGNIDDGDDIIEPGAFRKTIAERGNRVRVFYAHDWDKLIGPPPRVLREDEHGLFAAGKLTLESFWGKEAWVLMKDNALVEGSIGYQPVKFDFDEVDGRTVRHLREVKLFEISPVPLGMNALTQVRAVKQALLAQMARKGAKPPHTTPKADEDTEWDAAAVLRQVEGAEQLWLIHAWRDDDGDPDAKSSYKLPHHLPDGRVVWRGVAAAGAAIMGARGGVSIPESDIPGVKRHLARHYEQFDKTPPWEEEAGLEEYLEALQAITDEIKDGRILSTAAKDKVSEVAGAMTAALETLNEIVEAAEPDTVHSALLVRRLRAAELALSLAQQD